MYASPGNREADIDRDARLPMAELRAKLEEESAGLRRQVAEMPATAWNHEVRSAKGASIIASRLPWLRTREVWVHAVDLDTGARFSYLPSEVFTGLFHERLGTLASSASCPSMALVDTDSGRAYEVGANGPQVHVSGPAPVLLGWLLGRDSGALLSTDSDTGHPPELPTWP